MKNIAILVADGFEDTELIGAIDFWKREDIDFELISIQDKNVTKGSFFAKVDTTPISKVSLNEFENLFITGGKSVSIFKDFKEINKIILDFYNNNKGIFAICAAPSLLYEINILENKNFTCWPGLNLSKSTNSEVEISDNIITGKDFLATIKFASEVSKFIKK